MSENQDEEKGDDAPQQIAGEHDRAPVKAVEHHTGERSREGRRQGA